jgi:hypothetical protein
MTDERKFDPLEAVENAQRLDMLRLQNEQTNLLRTISAGVGPGSQTTKKTPRKPSKALALTYAAILGPFGWLYTFEKNWKKCALGFVVTLAYVLVSMSLGELRPGWLDALFLVGIRVWPFLDYWFKSPEYFSSYPNSDD